MSGWPRRTNTRTHAQAHMCICENESPALRKKATTASPRGTHMRVGDRRSMTEWRRKKRLKKMMAVACKKRVEETEKRINVTPSRRLSKHGVANPSDVRHLELRADAVYLKLIVVLSR